MTVSDLNLRLNILLLKLELLCNAYNTKFELVNTYQSSFYFKINDITYEIELNDGDYLKLYQEHIMFGVRAHPWVLWTTHDVNPACDIFEVLTYIEQNILQQNDTNI